MSDVRDSYRSVMDHVVDHHGLKVSLISMANYSLGFSREFVSGDLFLSETLIISLENLNEGMSWGLV